MADESHLLRKILIELQGIREELQRLHTTVDFMNGADNPSTTVVRTDNKAPTSPSDEVPRTPVTSRDW